MENGKPKGWSRYERGKRKRKHLSKRSCLNVTVLRARLQLEKAKRDKTHSDCLACEKQGVSVICEEVSAEPVQIEPVEGEGLPTEPERKENQFDWKMIDLTEYTIR